VAVQQNQILTTPAQVFSANHHENQPENQPLVDKSPLIEALVLLHRSPADCARAAKPLEDISPPRLA